MMMMASMSECVCLCSLTLRFDEGGCIGEMTAHLSLTLLPHLPEAWPGFMQETVVKVVSRQDSRIQRLLESLAPPKQHFELETFLLRLPRRLTQTLQVLKYTCGLCTKHPADHGMTIQVRRVYNGKGILLTINFKSSKATIFYAETVENQIAWDARTSPSSGLTPKHSCCLATLFCGGIGNDSPGRLDMVSQ